MLLRLFGATVGHKVKLYPTVKIWAPWNLTLDEDCSLGDGVDCYSVAPIHVGAFATISQHTTLCTASHDASSLNLPLTTGAITIGRHAWVCAQCFIMPNVSIGEGAVVGVRSTVFEDVEPWKIAIGTPCRVLRDRVVKEVSRIDREPE
jgi:putative colanic acid biosynthesis acetyltransferase WcaF